MQAQRENEYWKGSDVLTNDDTAKGKLNKQRKQKCEGNNNDTESDSDLRREETKKRGTKQVVQSPPKKRRGISVVVTADSHSSEESIEKNGNKEITHLVTPDGTKQNPNKKSWSDDQMAAAVSEWVNHRPLDIDKKPMSKKMFCRVRDIPRNTFDRYCNKNAANAKQKEYRTQNKHTINKKRKEHRTQNKDAINKKQKEHRTQNKDAINAKQKEYRTQNKDTINAKRKVCQKKYRTKKRVEKIVKSKGLIDDEKEWLLTPRFALDEASTANDGTLRDTNGQHYLGLMNEQCGFCGALGFQSEIKGSKVNPKLPGKKR